MNTTSYAEARAALAATPAAAPQGWKLVPVEPTPEMLRAEPPDGFEISWQRRPEVWAAMLAAAPVAATPAAPNSDRDAALAAGVQMGNSLGISSPHAIRIIAAYELGLVPSGAATPVAEPAQCATYDDATELALGKAYRAIAIDRPWLARDDFEAAYRAGLAATPAAPQDATAGDTQ